MFSDHVLYESMGIYDTYNKLTLVVREPNPCVAGWNTYDLVCQLVMGEETICDIPFDNGECEFSIELTWPPSGSGPDFDYLTYYGGNYPNTFKYGQPVFSQKAGSSDDRVLEVTTNAFISVDTSQGDYLNTFFFSGNDPDWMLRLWDSDGAYIDVPFRTE